MTRESVLSKELITVLSDKGYIRGPFGSALIRSELKSSGIPVYEQQHAIAGVREFRYFIDDEKFQKLKRFQVRTNDLIISCSGTIGKISIVKESDPKGIISQALLILRPDIKAVNPSFLYYFFNTHQGFNALLSASHGAAQQNIAPREVVEKISIPMIELYKQNRIVDILQSYDDLIESNLKRIKMLEEMAQMIYSEWFVNFCFAGHEKVKMVKSELGMIPEGWEVKKLGELTNLISRGISPQYNDRAENIVINQRCIRDFRLSLENTRRNSKKVTTEKLVQKGDILINSTGVGTLGRLSQVLVDMHNCTVDSHVTIVRPSKEVTADFIGLQLFALQSYFESQGKGATGQTELSRESVSNVDCIVPPKRLRMIFSDIVNPLRILSIQLGMKNDNLRKTRELLLPKLISGEIDVEKVNINVGMKSV